MAIPPITKESRLNPQAAADLLAVAEELVKRWASAFYEISHEDLVDRARAATTKAKGVRL